MQIMLAAVKLPVPIEYLIVGGGGPGGTSMFGSTYGAGGGGGAVLPGSAILLPGVSYDATVAGPGGTSQFFGISAVNGGGGSQRINSDPGIGGTAGPGGGNGGNCLSGNGAPGTQSSITGTAIYYGNGGKAAPGAYGVAGAANTGDGGNGNENGNVEAGYYAYGGPGGSGLIVVRYLGAQKYTGGTISTVGSYTVHKFTSTGTLVPL